MSLCASVSVAVSQSLSVSLVCGSYNVTLMDGCGSYTMFGPPGVFERSNRVSPDCGVALRACDELLNAAAGSAGANVKMNISMQ